MSQSNELTVIDRLAFLNTATGEVETHLIKDTEYSVAEKGAAGLCPALPNEDTTTKYLRQDGTWVDPNYTVISTEEINTICV